MPACSAVTVTVPPVLLLVTRHAAIGIKIFPIAFDVPPTMTPFAVLPVWLLWKMVGPADDGKTPVGSSMVTSICHVEESADVLTPKPMFIGPVACQLVSFQGELPDEVCVT
jgi:hypothetical protein